jgi:DNA polymerase III delta prime subunit
MENLWIDKYSPKNMTDLIINETNAHKLATWIKTYGKYPVKKKARDAKNINDFTNIIITGPRGVGKSCTVDTVVKSLGMVPIELDINNIDKKLFSSKTSDTNYKLMKNLCDKKNVKSQLVGDKSNGNVIVVDNIDTISSTNNKAVVTQIQKINNLHKIIPLILISSNQHNKFISDLKKVSYNMPFYPPKKWELHDIILKICKQEKIGINKADKFVIESIITCSQNDIRRLITILYEINQLYNTKPITKKMITNLTNIMQNKDMYLDLYTASNKLMCSYKNIDECLKLFESDKVTMPLMIHENYNRVLSKSCTDKSTRTAITDNIVDLISMGDVIDNMTYSGQSWDLQEIYGHYTCTIPSYLISSNCEPCDYIKLEYPDDFNKTSIKKINRKNIINTTSNFMTMDITDYVYLGKIMNHYIENDDVDKCVKIMKDYDLTNDDIHSLLKIDKIDGQTQECVIKKRKEFFKEITAKLAA